MEKYKPSKELLNCLAHFIKISNLYLKISKIKKNNLKYEN